VCPVSAPAGQVGGVYSPWGWPSLVYFPSCFPSAVFLSFFGIASIGLSCLVALFLYHVVFGIQYLGILNGVAAFVIVGIGKHVLVQTYLCCLAIIPACRREEGDGNKCRSNFQAHCLNYV